MPEPLNPVTPLTLPISNHAAENLFKFLLQNTPDEIYFKDREGRFLCLSNAVAAAFGAADPSEIIGKTDSELLGKASAKESAQDELRIMATGEPLVGKIERWDKSDGRVEWSHTTKLPLRSAEGEIVGICGINKNVTILQKAEEALREERNNLRAITEELQARNAQLQADLQLARELQEAMLPRDYPSLSNGREAGRVSFAHCYRPAAAVGGDFFDIFPLSQTRSGIFICDVMGHGMRAALITAIIRGLLEELRPEMADAGGFMSVLNERLRAILSRVEEPLVATAFYLIADTEHHEIQFANAGHPEPTIFEATKGNVESLKADGVRPGCALGLFDKSVYLTRRRRFEPGDRIFLFTDGLYEVDSPEGEQFGQAALVSTLRHHAKLPTNELLSAVLADVSAFARRSDFDDDVCIVVAEQAVD